MKNPQRTLRKSVERVIRPFAFGTALVAASTGCTPAPASGEHASVPTRAPQAHSGPHVIFPSGIVISVEVARTDPEKSQGLMFRESMPKENGMIFLFDGLEVRPFWMKNCHFSLDMIYTLKDGTVVDVLKNIPPCTEDPCPSYPPKAPADTVVEVNAGVAARNGVVAGAKLLYRDIPER